MIEKPEERDERSLRILVVDDNPHVLSALVDLLEEERRVDAVDAASRVDEAISLALSHRPDAVFVDVHMPGGGGRQVITTIRGLLPRARIVALSAHLEQDTVSQVLSTGADLYFSKTTDFTHLMRSLKL